MASKKRKRADDTLYVPSSAHGYIIGAKVHPNMTCRQMAILAMMAAHPGVSVRHIAKALNVPKPVVTRASDKLLEIGLIYRSTSPLDRRQVELSASKSGFKLLRDAGVWTA